jgi:hypothetical protein
MQQGLRADHGRSSQEVGIDFIGLKDRFL